MRFLDERAPKLDVFAHQDGEEPAGAAGRVLVAHLQERAGAGSMVSPRELGVHLAETLSESTIPLRPRSSMKSASFSASGIVTGSALPVLAV